ncbi:MAG: hypothetical protein H7238_00135 [Polaromonas sp.]|nr:hypothetical protein [Polaromonas sp.]
MFTLNQKISEGIAVLATVDAASQAPGTVTTPWVDQSLFFFVLAMVGVGAFGASATVDAKLQQATDVGGTGAKDITGKAIVQMLAASGNNKQVLVSMKEADLDTENGFRFVRLSVTVGTAATLLNALLLGGVPRFQPASAYNQAGVTQIVG